ncbi:hypothetical protein [Streptococcus sobrinus]|uniref:hypothetical protein n=1 Tax=Streptococcus sobrinus TaxID=1310 RepID=UPI00030F5D34|nr:hypothetical protein [Streptococcus sobrinus]
MLNLQKIKSLKVIGAIIGAVMILSLVFGIGRLAYNHHQKREEQKMLGTELTSKYVKEFLVAFYTKQDLGENRDRYKPFMTTGMYNSMVNQEDSPLSQSYKGYIVNYKFQSADIYINKEDSSVIATIRYTNDLLKKKGSTEDAQLDFENRITMKFDFKKVDGKYLVDDMSSLLIANSNTGDDDTLAYGSVIPSSSSSTEQSSQGSTTEVNND